SAELLGGVILAVAAGFFWMMGAWFFGAIHLSIQVRLTEFADAIEDPKQLIRYLTTELSRVAIVVLAVIVPVGALAAASGLLQTNFNFSMKPLELKPEKMSVIKGFGKIFSSQSVVRGGLSIAKAIVIVCLVVFVAQAKMDQITMSGFGSIQELLFFLASLLIQCSLAIAAVIALLALIDLAYQKWKHLQDMKMSVRDIKEENKSSEGDPHVRARMKKLQAELGQKRMFADIPKSTAVITNPTHFAVAIQYERDKMDAPIVLAKGADFVAKKIIEIAQENGVPVVQRKPVARFLFKHTEIGQSVPVEMYQAIAEILNFVSKMKSIARSA
ncbi:MAG: EscU/YscU/HrcU family type III secretion system export apparatus switch protein, partial [Planctomycetota bacterium]